MGTAARSLREIHPRRWDIPCGVAAIAVLLMFSLNLPVLYVEKLFIAAVLASMAMTKYMTRLARNARRDGRRSGA